MEQTLAHGKTPTATPKWAKLGGYTGPMVKHPARITAFLLGLPGEGKSAFLQSCPDAFILNLDKTSTTTPEVKASIWPGVNSDGEAINSEGNSFVLTCDHVNQKLAVLRELANNDEPRPKLIVFDSLTEWVRLLRNWVPRNALSLGIHGSNTENWRELHGPAAWDELYGIVVETIADLANHGYGVYLVGHMVNETIPLGDDRYAFRPGLTITPKFWKRLYDMFEMVGYVYREEVTKVEEVEEKVTIRGEEKLKKRRVSNSSKKYFFTADKKDFEGLLKQRVELPDQIELPHAGGWEAFERAYVQAM